MVKFKECFCGYYKFGELKEIISDLNNWCDLVIPWPSLDFGYFLVTGYKKVIK